MDGCAVRPQTLFEVLLYKAHIPQLRERRNRIVNTQDQASEEYVDEVVAAPEPAFGSRNQCILHLNTMLTYLKVKDANEAWLAIKKAGAFVPAAVSPRRMEYLKHLVIASIASGDLELTCANLETMIASASTIESDLWRNDLQSTYACHSPQNRAKRDSEAITIVLSLFFVFHPERAPQAI